MNAVYTCNEKGINLDGSETVSWWDLEDALASACNPFSSAAAIRADLLSALDADEVQGDKNRLVAVLEKTAFRGIIHPGFTNDEISSLTG